MQRLRRILSAPARFVRYLNRPGQELKAQHEAMSPAEKEAGRAQSLKRNGWFLSFVNMKPPKRKP